jgi:hypothetical protein
MSLRNKDNWKPCSVQAHQNTLPPKPIPLILGAFIVEGTIEKGDGHCFKL